MGDPPKSPTNNFYGILGIPRSASLPDICKAYRSLVLKWHPDRNPTNKAEAEFRFSSINAAYRALSMKKREEAMYNGGRKSKIQKKKNKSQDYETEHNVGGLQISQPTLLSRTTSRVSPVPSPTFYTCSSTGSTTPPHLESHTSSEGNTPTTPNTPTDNPIAFTKVASRHCTTPIFFSQSATRKKPPPIEKKIDCTLEELSVGCVKKIKITRDAISTSGLIVQEEEILMIQVQPGWKKGTKITFEGKGDERPGSLPADIIFSIHEKRHPMYKRIGDNLELGVEVPLVQALTGCNIDVPLLGGGQINVSIDDIIYPGYEKIVPGQGMPISKEGKRGDLKLKFLVDFPTQLSDDQRSKIVNILEKCS